MNLTSILGRTASFFHEDIQAHEAELSRAIKESTFLVIGGAGTIGQAVTMELFKRSPRKLHVVDLSENNLVELVRDLRSSEGYIDGDFRTFAIDSGSSIFKRMIENEGPYDYILNLSALKHVRSEKDPYTLLRMIQVNIINTVVSTEIFAAQNGVKYFCVSTDKATNPVNMMGASKRIMELFLMRESAHIDISTARFANVAFSDGSLLHGFNQRFLKRQPLSAPSDIRRFFLSPEESGQLCLMSCILGKNRDIFFPQMESADSAISFPEIAQAFLEEKGYGLHICSTEEEARNSAEESIRNMKWPCYFSESDTTGEKEIEEFYTLGDTVDLDQFERIGVLQSDTSANTELLEDFYGKIRQMVDEGVASKSDVVDLFKAILPEFNHKETGKYLDQQM